jgi:hypothetical protein
LTAALASLIRGVSSTAICYLLSAGVLGAIWSYDCGPLYFIITMQMMVLALIVFLVIGLAVAVTGLGSLRLWFAGVALSLLVFLGGYIFSTHSTFRNGGAVIPGTNCAPM